MGNNALLLIKLAWLNGIAIGIVTNIAEQVPVIANVVFKDKTIADEILDRLGINVYCLDLKGPSRRSSVEHQPLADDVEAVL